MLATYTYTESEAAIVAKSPTLDTMAGYLAANAISPFAFAKYAKDQAEPALALDVKMSDKGCIHVTGINGKYGVALYPQQMIALLDMSDRIRKFATDNATELAKRGDAEKARKAAEKQAAKQAPTAPTAPTA